jgi:hypothetical protein
MSQIVGLRELRDAFRDFGGEVGARTVTGVALAGQQFSNDVKSVAPLGHMPGLAHGDYRRSIHVEMQEDEHQAVALVGTNKIQAKQLEFGGIIRAKNKPFLVFQTEDGQWHHVKVVHQPGHPHFQPTLDNNRQNYREIIRRTIVA